MLILTFPKNQTNLAKTGGQDYLPFLGLLCKSHKTWQTFFLFWHAYKMMLHKLVFKNVLPVYVWKVSF